MVGVAGDVTAAELGPLLDLAFGDLPATSAPADARDDGAARRRAPCSGAGTCRRARCCSVRPGLAARRSRLLRRLCRQSHPGRRRLHLAADRGGAREARPRLLGLQLPLPARPCADLARRPRHQQPPRSSEALRLVRQEIERVAAGEISQARLDDAKTYLTGSFPLRLTSNDEIARHAGRHAGRRPRHRLSRPPQRLHRGGDARGRAPGGAQGSTIRTICWWSWSAARAAPRGHPIGRGRRWRSWSGQRCSGGTAWSNLLPMSGAMR